MTRLRRTLEGKAAKQAAKALVRHSAHGVVAKVERKPVRAASLLVTGLLVGSGAGWLAGRKVSAGSS